MKSPKTEPKPKEPYTEDEVLAILAACDQLGRGAYERDRARAMVFLLRFTGLRISDVETLARDRVRDDRICLYTMKNGKHHSSPLRSVDATRQERISSLAQDVWSGKFLASSKNPL